VEEDSKGEEGEKEEDGGGEGKEDGGREEGSVSIRIEADDKEEITKKSSSSSR